VTQTATKPQPETTQYVQCEDASSAEFVVANAREHSVKRLRLLWDQRVFVARAVLVGLVLGGLLAFSLPKRYEASTRLMPPDSQSSSGMAMLAAMAARTGGGLGAFAGDLLGLQSSGALFVGILRSETVEGRLVERFSLKKVYGAPLEEDAGRSLSENTRIEEDRKSGIITIAVTDRDPKRAAAIAQAYVEELDRLVAELSTSAAHRERVFLEERLTAVKQELDLASQKFSQFASKNAAIDIKEQGRAMLEASATLMGQLIAAESELKGLEEIYTPSNVRVRSVQARVSELRKQLEKIGGKEGTEADKAGTSGDPLYPSIRKLPLLGVTYADLYRQTKIQEEVYETLTQEYELAKVQEAKETPSVKVLDIAKIPERKSFPPRLLIMLLCGFLVLAGAMVLALGKARWQEVDAQDPAKVFVQEVFQTVNANMPWASPNGSRWQATTHRVWTKLVRRRSSVEKAE